MTRRNDELVIGLVNNMPPSARQEWQFRDLLSVAAQGRAIRLRVFRGPGLDPANQEQSCALAWESIDALWSSELVL